MHNLRFELVDHGENKNLLIAVEASWQQSDGCSLLYNQGEE